MKHRSALARLSSTWSSALPVVERCVPWLCLAALGVRFYPLALRFLDIDEIYYLYVSAAIARGEGLYSDLRFFYPPVTWYAGAVFFKLCADPFAALLAIRLFILSLGMLGFALVFDMFRRLQLTWFIVPTAFLIAFQAQFTLKLNEFRGDNLLALVVVSQAYLLFRLAVGHRRPGRIVGAFLFLTLLSFHINQKAVIIEPALVLSLVLTQWGACVGFLRAYGTAMLVTAVPIVGVLALWPAYHRFFDYAYVYSAKTLLPLQLGGKLDFLHYWGLQNFGFWALGLLSAYMLIIGLRRHVRLTLSPLLLLGGSSLLQYVTFFPFIQYQLFLVWAALVALPVGVWMARRELELPAALLWTICALGALSSLVTYSGWSFPQPPLKEYATLIRRTKEVVGEEPLAALGGASITIKSQFPHVSYALVGNSSQWFGRGDGRYREWNMREVLTAASVKFLFIPIGLDVIKTHAKPEDGKFIGLHYATCPDLPLLIASRWYWIDPSVREIQVDIAGDYTLWAFRSGEHALSIDGEPVENGQTLHLDSGAHAVIADAPTALLTEFASPRIRSLELSEIAGAKDAALWAASADFSGRFALLGILRLDGEDHDVYRIFWRKTGSVDRDLLTFHHFVDTDATVHSENVDPGAGWYSLKTLPVGEVFSYQFRADKDWRTHWLRIGLCEKENIAWRLPLGGETYYTFDLSQLQEGRRGDRAFVASRKRDPSAANGASLTAAELR